MIFIAVAISLTVGIILGYKCSKYISQICVTCYFISTGRTVRASESNAKEILNGKYYKDFNNIRIKRNKEIKFNGNNS
jgi:hypothetical protein